MYFRSPVSAVPFGCVWSPPPAVLALSPPLYPRSCCRWLVLMTATPAQRAAPAPWVTSPRLPTPQSARPTPTLLPTCGQRLSSASLPSRSTLTSWPSTTSPSDTRDRSRSSTNKFESLRTEPTVFRLNLWTLASSLTVAGYLYLQNGMYFVTIFHVIIK